MAPARTAIDQVVCPLGFNAPGASPSPQSFVDESFAGPVSSSPSSISGISPLGMFDSGGGSCNPFGSMLGKCGRSVLYFSSSLLDGFFHLLLLLIFFHVGPAQGRPNHVIRFRTPHDLSPSSLVWDGHAQHFLVGSLSHPTVSSVSDAGVFETLINDSTLPSGASIPSISIDRRRRRLLAVVRDVSSAPCLASYDLDSLRRLFLSRLPVPSFDDASGSSDPPFPHVPSSVTVDPSTGAAFVTSESSCLIWKVDAEGKAWVFSNSNIHAGDGFHGVTHVGRGFLLAVQRTSGGIVKIDSDDGKTRSVSVGKDMSFVGADGVAVRSDGTAVVVGGRSGGKGWILKSEDGWIRAGVYDEIMIGEGIEGVDVKGVTLRDLRISCVLYGNGKDWIVEEVVSERENADDWVWLLVTAGIAFTFFFIWRFQMRSLISGMNKKKV